MYVTYDTLSDVIEDRAIARGWIPNWVPETATNIHEVQNLDTNAELFIKTLVCQDANAPNRPSKRTELFPKSTHLEEGIKDCDDLFVFLENEERIHVWANYHR